MNWGEFLQPGIFSVTGKPGAGKSYFSLRLIIAEIKAENRTIITNVPVRKKRLRKYVKKDFKIHTLQTFEDNHLFFTQRGDYSYEIPDETQVIDFSKHIKEDDGGVLYVIDEAHLYFNSRNWKTLANATLSFFTFIRHCGDTLIYLTQKATDVDTQLRGKTQTFNLIRNLARERMGLLKRGNGFRVYQFLKENDINNYANAVQDFSYGFNLKVAECYRTSLFNKNRDKRFKIPGVTFKHVVIGLVVLLCLLLWWIGNGGFVKMFGALMPDLSVVDGEDPAGEVQRVPAAVVRSIEVPVGIMPHFGQRWLQVSEAREREIVDFVTGSSVNTTLSFFVEKDEIEKGLDFSLRGMWKQYQRISSIDILQEYRAGYIRTDVFEAFISWVRDESLGSTLKELNIILKEGIPCTVSQGFEIPLARTIATQGVQTTNYDYRKVGFTLSIELDKTAQGMFVMINVENTQVLDSVDHVPTLNNFSTTNVYSVQPGRTYEIAVFESRVEESVKRLLGNRQLSSNITNRCFLSFPAKP